MGVVSVSVVHERNKATLRSPSEHQREYQRVPAYQADPSRDTKCPAVCDVNIVVFSYPVRRHFTCFITHQFGIIFGLFPPPPCLTTAVCDHGRRSRIHLGLVIRTNPGCPDVVGLVAGNSSINPRCAARMVIELDSTSTSRGCTTGGNFFIAWC